MYVTFPGGRRWEQNSKLCHRWDVTFSDESIHIDASIWQGWYADSDAGKMASSMSLLQLLARRSIEKLAHGHGRTTLAACIVITTVRLLDHSASEVHWWHTLATFIDWITLRTIAWCTLNVICIVTLFTAYWFGVQLLIVIVPISFNVLRLLWCKSLDLVSSGFYRRY